VVCLESISRQSSHAAEAALGVCDKFSTTDFRTTHRYLTPQSRELQIPAYVEYSSSGECTLSKHEVAGKPTPPSTHDVWPLICPSDQGLLNLCLAINPQLLRVTIEGHSGYLTEYSTSSEHPQSPLHPSLYLQSFSRGHSKSTHASRLAFPLHRTLSATPSSTNHRPIPPHSPLRVNFHTSERVD
jgi:hypothetical protein